MQTAWRKGRTYSSTSRRSTPWATCTSFNSVARYSNFSYYYFVEINTLDCLAIFVDRACPTMVCSPASTIFNDTVIGYVMTVKRDTMILVTTNPHPYMIPTEIANKYFLSDGDKVSALVSADGGGKHIVTGILRVNRQEKTISNYAQHFDNMTGTPSTGMFAINRQNIALGSTAMIRVKQNELTNERAAEIICTARVPNMITISLGINEKPENLTYLLAHGCDYGYGTTVMQPLKQQLMIALSAFFRAKELTERGHNVLLFVSSFEKLLYLFNSAILDCSAATPAHSVQNAERDLLRVITQSKTLGNGGSLTIVGFQIKDAGEDERDLRQRISTMCDFVI